MVCGVRLPVRLGLRLTRAGLTGPPSNTVTTLVLFMQPSFAERYLSIGVSNIQHTSRPSLHIPDTVQLCAAVPLIALGV